MDGTNLDNTGSGFTPQSYTQQQTTTPGAPQTPGAPPQGAQAARGAPSEGTGTAGVGGTGVTSSVGGMSAADLEELMDTLSQTDLDSLFNTTTSNATTPSTPYTANPNTPNLEQSNVNDPQLAQQTLYNLQNPTPDQVSLLLTDYINSQYPPTDTTDTTEETTDTTASLSTGDTDDSSATASVSTDIKTQSPIDPSTIDPQIVAFAQQKGLSLETVVQSLQEQENDQFNQQVSNLVANNTITQAQADQITFAHFMPSEATNLSPALQAQLTSIMQQVNQNMANANGFSDDFTGVPTDSTDFTQNLELEANQLFTKVMDQMGLSPADVNALKAMQAGLSPGTPTLQNILTQIQSQVTAQLQAKYGFDVSYQPTGDPTFYANVINGDFAQTFQKAVGAWIPSSMNLTSDQTATIQQYQDQYAANPNDPSIPAAAKALLDQFMGPITQARQAVVAAFPDMSSLPDNLKSDAQALLQGAENTIISKYDLNTNWTPSITSLTNTSGIDQKTINTIQNGLNMANEIYNQATAYANSLPDGPEKTTYLNFLKTIGLALQNMQDTLYSIQASQSNVSNKESRVQLDMQLNDIAKQQRAADKIEQQEAKMKSLGPIGKAFEWLIKIILVIISVWMGPISFLLASALLTDQIASSAMGHKETGFDMLMEKMSSSLPPAAAAAIKGTLLAMITLLTANPYLVVYMATDKSKAVQDMVATCGGDQMAQQMTAMVVNLIAQIALAVMVAVVTGGVGAFGMVEAVVDEAGAVVLDEAGQVVYQSTSISSKFAQSVADSLDWSAKGVELSASITKAAQATILNSIQITSSGINLNNDLALANIDIIKGDAEKYSEQVQAIIGLIKKMIQKILALLQGNVDQIANISTMQGQKWSEASSINDNIFA